MKFIIDTQLPPILAKYLTERGYEAIHTTYFDNGHLLQDEEIIIIATQEERIITTKDSDFLDNFILNGAPPKVLLLQFGNIKNKDLLDLFDKYLEQIVIHFQEGSNLVVFDKIQISGY